MSQVQQDQFHDDYMEAIHTNMVQSRIMGSNYLYMLKTMRAETLKKRKELDQLLRVLNLNIGIEKEKQDVG